MKKIFAVILSVVFVLSLSGCFLEGICYLYDYTEEKDGFLVCISERTNCCFVGFYDCNEYSENMEITIPDDYKGIPIKRIGGYYGTGVPTPFCISVWDVYCNAPESSEYNGIYAGDINNYGFEDEYTVEELVFVLNIGKNIDTVENVMMDEYYPHINDDDSITFYHPVVKINCSEDNKHFYSEDGKLYDRKTRELISVFEYAE